MWSFAYFTKVFLTNFQKNFSGTVEKGSFMHCNDTYNMRNFSKKKKKKVLSSSPVDLESNRLNLVSSFVSNMTFTRWQIAYRSSKVLFVYFDTFF